MTTDVPPSVPHPPAPAVREELTEDLEELLDALDPNPAYVVGARWDVLGANAAAKQLFSDWDAKRRRRERNLLWYYCCDPAARSLFVDWEQEAEDQLALFRLDHARHAGDPAFRRLLDQIFEANPDALEWWERLREDRAAGRRRGGTKRIRLDTGRVVRLRQLTLQVTDQPDLTVISYFSDADDDVDDAEFDS
jgi:hypothetical protein